MTSIVTDLTGDDDETDETIICKRCTFINSSFLNYCELCEAPLKNNFMLNNNNQSPEGSITRKKEIQSEQHVKSQKQQLVESLQNENTVLRKELQELRRLHDGKKRKRDSEMQNNSNNKKMENNNSKHNYTYSTQKSIPTWPSDGMATVIDSSINLNYGIERKCLFNNHAVGEISNNSMDVKPNVNFDMEEDEDAAMDEFQEDEMHGIVPGKDLGLDQKIGFDLCKEGHNLFITGVAGTGKSWLLKHIIKYFKTINTEVSVMAPTGIAAVNVGGCTLHSFCGIGIPKGPKDFEKMKNKGPASRILKSKVWIIDEISMCSGELLDKIEEKTRAIRQNDAPFGGIQMIFCGDFLQLPPVKNAINPVLLQDAKDANQIFLNRGMAFQSNVWNNANIQTIRLAKVYRQGGDRDMVLALQDLRLGKISAGVQCLVNETMRQLSAKDGIEATKLYCKNLDVDLINKRKLDQLPDHKFGEIVYNRYDSVSPDPKLKRTLTRPENNLLSKFFDQVRVKPHVQLKVGAQVMCLQNDNTREKLVNGSRGVITGFKTWVETFVLLKHELHVAPDGIGGLIELKIRWLHEIFEGNNVPDYKRTTFFPIVKFESGREYIITPVEFSSEIDKLGKAARIQVPLALAWAITIHKSQGMSIDRLVVKVDDCFAEGQAYVALSRATSKNGLQIQGFTNRCVLTSKLALQFENKMIADNTNNNENNKSNVNGSSNEMDIDDVIPQWLDEARKNWDKIRSDILESYAAQEVREYPNCRCNVRSKRLQVRKAGRNQGKYFFTCHKNYKDNDKCGFFQWDV